MASHTTTPPPLPAHVTRLVLRHLAPPGEPVPPEFLSTATRQRHGLLGLKPSDAGYYSWALPAHLEATHVADPQRVVAALEALNLTTLEDAPLPTPRYVHQGEGIFQAQAHVPTPNQGDLVLVFVCEGETTDPKWKLFDVRLALPNAPPSGFATIEEAAASTKSTAADAKNDVDGDANDPYWDSYHSPTELANSNIPDADTTAGAGEDAYWNRYGETAGSDTEEDEVASLHVPGTTGRQFATTRKPMFPPPPPPRSRSRSPANLPADASSSVELLADLSLNSPGPNTTLLPSIQTTSASTLRTNYHAAGVPTVSPRFGTPSRGIAGPSIQMPLSPRHSLASNSSLSPRLPPAPSGSRPLDLPISPTFAHVQHLMHHGLQNANGGFVAEPEGLNIHLGTPPPTLPTLTAPLPNSPSITLTSQLSFTGLGFDKGKGRASSVPGNSPSRSMSTDDCALAINLNPTSTSPSVSVGPSPSSASLGGTGAGPAAAGLNSNMPSSASASVSQLLGAGASTTGGGSASSSVTVTPLVTGTSSANAMQLYRQSTRDSLVMPSPVTSSRTNSLGPQPFTPLSAVSSLSGASLISAPGPHPAIPPPPQQAASYAMIRRSSHPLSVSHRAPGYRDASGHSAASSVSSGTSASTAATAATTPPPVLGLTGVEQDIADGVRAFYRIWKAARAPEEAGGGDDAAAFGAFVDRVVRASDAAA